MHPFSKVLDEAKLPMVIVSSDILRRNDGKAISHTLNKLCNAHKIIKPDIHWDGYNVLLKSAAEAGAYEIGLSSSMTEEERNKPCKLLYLLGADEVLKEKPKDTFVIYQVLHMIL